MKTFFIPTGYEYVQLGAKPKGLRISVHRLVLLTFKGPCPEGMECCHGKGGPRDNRLENLRWGTHLENVREAEHLGYSSPGELNPKAKLNVEQVRKIRTMYATKMYRQVDLGKMFGVGQDTISSIVRRETWGHIQ